MIGIGESLVRVFAAAARPRDQLPSWFAVVFAGMWLLATTLLAMICGHMALLSRYPPVDERTPERFSFASGAMRGIPYQRAMHVAIGSRGLHLAPSWLFRPLTHRGIPCVPWGELRCTRGQAERGGRIPRCSRFEIPRIGLRFEVCGNAGLAVESALVRAGGAAQG